MKFVAGLVLTLVLSAGLGAGLATGQTPHVAAADRRIAVVAAENFYGDIARQVGGDRVALISIMSNPDQDPHLFETTPAVVRQLANAQIVILNGANYDPWMDKLLSAVPRPGRVVINAAQLSGRKAGDNPHVWYDPATMPAMATALAGELSKLDSAHAADYAERLKTTLVSLARITQRIAQLKAKHSGNSVTATEPSARDVAALESDLKEHKVKALIYNSQVSEKLTERMRAIAGAAKVPVIAVTETMPANISFQDWVLGELDVVDKTLSGPNS